MKILLYFEGKKVLEKSGIGKALEHQKKALTSVGVDYTLNPQDTDYDILHINTYGVNSYRMVRKARKAGKKVIYHAHSTEEDFRNSFIGSNQLAPFVKKYLTFLYKQADCLITPTPYAKKLLKSYGLTLPIYPISNGIELKRFAPKKEKEQDFLDYFQLTSEDKIVISVGLFFKRKGILDFIEVAKARPECTFIWFGSVPLYSIPSDIRKIVQGDHPENVIFPGYIKGDVLEGAYSKADVFFFPSYEETEGIVVLEALAAHQNVLVRDIPVYEGWLEDKKNCYMGRSNEEFIQLIDDMIAEKLPPLNEKGFLVAESRSIEKVGEQLKEVYEKTLNIPH